MYMETIPIRKDPETRRPTRLEEFNEAYLRRLSAGDPETERHFVQYFELLLRVRLQRRFRESGRADDIAQETLFRVLRIVRENPASIAHPDRLGPFVNSVCSNVILEGYRGDGRFHPASEFHLNRADPSMDAERSMLSAERQVMVRKVLYAMAPKDRLLLTEVFLEEQDKDEVCMRRGVGREYLRVMLFRALGRFRIELGKKF